MGSPVSRQNGSGRTLIAIERPTDQENHIENESDSSYIDTIVSAAPNHVPMKTPADVCYWLCQCLQACSI